MDRTGWEHHELEKEIAHSNTAQLLVIFKRESEKFSTKCVEYAHSIGKLTEAGRKELEEECKLINEGRQIVAMTIAEILTDVKRIQNQIYPNR